MCVVLRRFLHTHPLWAAGQLAAFLFGEKVARARRPSQLHGVESRSLCNLNACPARRRSSRRRSTAGFDPATGGLVRKQEGGSPVRLYDFGILIIVALVAAAVAAAILTQVHH